MSSFYSRFRVTTVRIRKVFFVVLLARRQWISCLLLTDDSLCCYLFNLGDYYRGLPEYSTLGRGAAPETDFAVPFVLFRLDERKFYFLQVQVSQTLYAPYISTYSSWVSVDNINSRKNAKKNKRIPYNRLLQKNTNTKNFKNDISLH